MALIKKPVSDAWLRKYNAVLITVLVFIGGFTSVMVGNVYVMIMKDHDKSIQYTEKVDAIENRVQALEYIAGLPKEKKNLIKNNETSCLIFPRR